VDGSCGQASGLNYGGHEAGKASGVGGLAGRMRHEIRNGRDVCQQLIPKRQVKQSEAQMLFTDSSERLPDQAGLHTIAQANSDVLDKNQDNLDVSRRL
jgi:hypothetical protein